MLRKRKQKRIQERFARKARRLNEGTSNWWDYPSDSWLDGNVPILICSSDQYTLEDNEEYIRDLCDANDWDYEDLSDNEKWDLLGDRDTEDVEIAREDFKMASERVIPQIFGKFSDSVEIEERPGYYEGVQWLYDVDSLTEVLNELTEDEISGILNSAGYDEIKDREMAYEVWDSVISAESLEELLKNRDEWIEWSEEHKPEDLDYYKNLFSDKVCEQIADVKDRCEKQVIGMADKAMRQIAKETGLKMAYYASGWSGPGYVEP